MPLDLLALLAEFSRTLPRFPDGRIDYTGAPLSLAVSCFVRCQNEILLLKRSERVGSYQKKWDIVAGYFDETIPVEEKVRRELQEETGITAELIASLTVGKAEELRDEKSGRAWITVPCLAELRSKPIVRIDWEHTEYAWIEPRELSRYDTVPDLEKNYARLSSI